LVGTKPSLLLASVSPRRRQLLTEAGFKFRAVAPRAHERFDVDLTVRELTALNAIRKGMSVARTRPRNVVLAADTLVAVDGEIFGKPKDIDHALAMLRRLAGRSHEVCSAVFICQLARARSTSFQETSVVRFRRLSDQAIRDYIDKVNPLDKAGAYAAQGFGSEIIERIDGSFSNVVGLPMEKTIPALVEFGLKPVLA
jgi:septum formation protein